MIVETTVQNPTSDGLRPFDAQRDLAQVADLIELAFRDELQRTGNRIVEEMRQLAHAGPLLRMFSASPALLSSLVGGYVWNAEGRIVGNVTLSLESRQRGVWVLSNVAVHPEYRGRGIARQLLQAALQEASRRGARHVLLEMRTDNPATQHLYAALGFRTYDTIAELCLPAHRSPDRLSPLALPLRAQRAKDWQELYDLHRAATPLEAQEISPILAHNYQLSLDRRLDRWFSDLLARRRRSNCVVEDSGHIVACLETTAYYAPRPHRLTITVHPASSGAYEEGLLAAGLRWLGHFPHREVLATVSLSHAQAREAFRRFGFEDVRVLDQMWLDLCHTQLKDTGVDTALLALRDGLDSGQPLAIEVED
jgi:ribosomal protein S18 acetylase RimI-like enzyme